MNSVTPRAPAAVGSASGIPDAPEICVKGLRAAHNKRQVHGIVSAKRSTGRRQAARDLRTAATTAVITPGLPGTGPTLRRARSHALSAAAPTAARNPEPIQTGAAATIA